MASPSFPRVSTPLTTPSSSSKPTPSKHSASAKEVAIEVKRQNDRDDITKAKVRHTATALGVDTGGTAKSKRKLSIRTDLHFKGEFPFVTRKGSPTVSEAGIDPFDYPVSNSRVEIDLKKFEANVTYLVKKFCAARPGEPLDLDKLLIVCKADGYGHSMRLIAPVLIKLGIKHIGITRNEEAYEFRRAERAMGIPKSKQASLARLYSASIDELKQGRAYDIEELVGTAERAQIMADIVRKDRETDPDAPSFKVHVGLTSGGMHRNGLDPALKEGPSGELVEDADWPFGREDLEGVINLHGKELDVVGFETHFTTEAPANIKPKQAKFVQAVEWIVKKFGLDPEKITRHSANTYASLTVPETSEESGSVKVRVRIGGGAYGESDAMDGNKELQEALLQCMTWKSNVSSLNRVRGGSHIGYDEEGFVETHSVLAQIPVGYANVYDRDFGKDGYVLINGVKCPIKGFKVSMNILEVDVTDTAARDKAEAAGLNVYPADHPKYKPGAKAWNPTAIPGIKIDSEAVLLGTQNGPDGEVSIPFKELENWTGKASFLYYTLIGQANRTISKPESEAGDE